MDLEKELNEFDNSIYQQFYIDCPYSSRMSHYTSPTAFENILKTKTLWLTNYSFLNDASEGQYIASLINRCSSNLSDDFKLQIKGFILEQLPARLESLEWWHKKGLSYPKKDNSKEWFICSFSEDEDCLSLWNYYTKTIDSVGYALSFSPGDFMRAMHQQELDMGFTISCQCVIYDLNEQLKIVGEILKKYDDCWNRANDYEKLCVIEQLACLIEEIRFYFKHPAFEAEKEYRIVASTYKNKYDCLLKAENSPIRFRQEKGCFIPYIEVHFDEYELKSVTISPSTKQKEAQKSVHMLLNKYGIMDCSVGFSDIPIR